MVTVVAPHGDARVFGGGLTNFASTVLDDVDVEHNRVVARSPTATLQGGGIWNGPFLGGVSGLSGQLSMRRSEVSDNVLSGPPAALLQGGGLYSELPVDRRQTRIEDNVPDQCWGCAASPAAQAGARSSVAAARSGRRTGAPAR
jgi:hypothetical protein